jgi:hypothetical protein
MGQHGKHAVLFTGKQEAMEMKKLILAMLVAMLVAMLTVGVSFAGGDKNCGTKGKGQTGTTAKGEATQKRTPLNR